MDASAAIKSTNLDPEAEIMEHRIASNILYRIAGELSVLASAENECAAILESKRIAPQVDLDLKKPEPDFSDRAPHVLFDTRLDKTSLVRLRNWLLVEEYDQATLPKDAPPKMPGRLKFRISRIRFAISEREKEELSPRFKMANSPDAGKAF